MAAQDQIEIINSQGDIRFHPLSGGGITNIGRHPDNDIIIDSPVVAPFHAILDHQNKPYRLVALTAANPIKVSGQVLQPNSPYVLHNWDTIELDGHSLVLMEGSGGSAPMLAPTLTPAPPPTPIPPIAPPAGGAAPQTPAGDPFSDLPDLDELDRLLAALPEDRSDDVIIVNPVAQIGAIDPKHPSALDFQVDVEQSATMQINVTNGGDLVGEFICEVRGLDPSWVAISPASVNLNDGGQGSFGIALTAPRLPSSRAKAYYFSIVVTSPNYPGRMNSIGGLLVLKPFYNYAVGDMQPRKQNISFTKRVGHAVMPISNLGNSPATFQLNGDDERHAATIEFDSPEEGLKLVGQVQLKVEPEQSLPVSIFVTPRKRRFIGFGSEDIHYSVTTTPLEGEQRTPRTVLGQARSQPFMGPIPIILIIILLLALIVWIFIPRINSFTADNTTISAGQDVVLSWSTSPFTSLHIDPDVGKVDGPQGSQKVAPTDNITYTLVAQTFLTSIYPPWFTAKKDVTLTVNPLYPKIQSFTVTDNGVPVEGVSAERTPGVFVGDKVTVSWQVEDADSLLLNINGAPQTIPAAEFTGSQTFVLNTDTTFQLQAINHYKPDGITKSVSIKVGVPPATPYPAPVLKEFSVSPQTITSGDEVTLTWDVTGVDKVTISNVTQELPPNGSLIVRPTENTSYVLTGQTPDGQKVTSAPYQVVVNPPPTATPVPQTPKIEYFQANPAQVSEGSAEAKSIQLTWSVTGQTTSISMTGPGGTKFSGLQAKGDITVSADKASLYVLTAANGSLSTSQTAAIKVNNPVPKITSISPSSSSDVGGSGFSLVINGSGFVKNSQVQWAGTNRSTTYISNTQLAAAILSEDMKQAGTFEVKVTNPTPGGGASGTATFTLSNPTPTISGLTPPNKIKGQPGFTLTVNGSNFIQGSVINFGGVDLTTTYISSTELSAQVAACEIKDAGNPAVIVTNPSPGGGPSAPANPAFEVFASFPKPTINTSPIGLSPATLNAGVDDRTITITGSGYIAGSSLVHWGNALLRPTVINSGKLTVLVPKANLASVGQVGVNIVNPTVGFNDSNVVYFQLTGVGLTITVDAPGTVLKNNTILGTVTLSSTQSADRTVTLTSANTALLTLYNVTSGASPTCNISSPLTTLIISPSSSTPTSARFCILGVGVGSTSITASLLSVPGSGIAQQTVTVLAQAPTITSLSVASNLAGGSLSSPCTNPCIGVGAAFDLTLNGTGLDNGAILLWNYGSANECDLNTTWVNSTKVVATILASCVNNSVGTIQVSVKNSDSADATATNFQVLAPTLSSISPITRTAGDTLFDLNLVGANFATTSVVYWNGSAQTTVFTDSQDLIAHIPASAIVSSATNLVTVVSPGSPSSYTTTSKNFTVTDPAISLGIDQSVSLNSTILYTVTLTPAQSIARSIIITSNSTNVTLRDSACTSTLPNQVTIPATPSNTASFCVFGASAGTATLTAQMADISSVQDTAVVTVNALPTTVTITKTSPSSDPKTGEPLAFHIAVTASGGTPTGTVTVTDTTNTLTLCSSLVLSSGTTDCSVPSGLASTSSTSRTIQAAFTSSNTNFSNNTGTLALQVNQADTTTALNATLTSTTATLTSPIYYGSSISFASDVNVVSPGTGNPTGTVNLYKGASQVASVASSGTIIRGMVLSTGTLDAGSYTATYQTSSAYNTSTSTPPFVINKANTSVSIISGTNPSAYGQAVTFTATVTNTSGTTATPTGSVSFTDSLGGALGCSAQPLNTSGIATCSTTLGSTTLSVATHTITATYTNADGNFNDGGTATVSQVVNKDNTSTTLSSSDADNTTLYGQSVTLTALVTNTDSTNLNPTGTVAFTANGSSINSSCNSATLAIFTSNSSKATCTFTTDLSAGTTYTLHAVYSPSPANFNASNSSASDISHTVNAATTSTTLASSDTDNITLYGTSVTLSATVANTASGSTGSPNGTVAFTANGSSINAACDSATLAVQTTTTSKATCTFTTELTVTNSPYTLHAVYTPASSPTNFSASNSTSSDITHTVNPAVTLTNVSSYATSIKVGGGEDNSSEFQFTVGLTGGAVSFIRTINLTTTNVPSGGSAHLSFTDCTSPPAPANVITAVNIPASSTSSVTFCAVGASAGSATVTATLSGSGGDSDTSTSSITVVNPSITLTGCSTVTASGALTIAFSVTINAAQTTATQIAMASSAGASVPTPVTIAAGSLSQNFTVTRVTTGLSTITATLPASLGSGTATPSPCAVTFTP